MGNKYVNAMNTLWLHARWWMTFLHITWIIGGIVDLVSDFTLGAYYASTGHESQAYYTIGFALVAGILNIFVVLFGIRQVPVLSGRKGGEKTDIVLSPVWRRILKYVVLFFTILLCGPVVLYFVMMVDLNKDFIDEDSAQILGRTLWITAIVELIIEQVPQTLLQYSIMANDNNANAAQLFAILTSIIGAACTFAGFVDLLARDRKGFFHLLTGRGLEEHEKEDRKTKARKNRESNPTVSKLETVVTVKQNNTPGYNSLVFLGLMVFLYLLPVALLSAQFDLSLFATLLIHAFPILFMLATKLFGMKNKPWIYVSLALTFTSVVVVSTVWYGTVSHGWLDGNKFAVNGTNSSVETKEAELQSLLPEDRGIAATIAQIGFLWTGTITTFTESSVCFYIFLICFSAFCLLLGILTSSFTPLPCCEDAAEEHTDDGETIQLKGDERDGQAKPKSVEENLTELRYELTSLKARMNVVEGQIKERDRKGKENATVA